MSGERAEETTPSSCCYLCTRDLELGPRLHGNGGLKKCAQSEFWADKCQANLRSRFSNGECRFLRQEPGSAVTSREQRRFRQGKVTAHVTVALLGSRKAGYRRGRPQPRGQAGPCLCRGQR